MRWRTTCMGREGREGRDPTTLFINPLSLLFFPSLPPHQSKRGAHVGIEIVDHGLRGLRGPSAFPVAFARGFGTRSRFQALIGRADIKRNLVNHIANQLSCSETRGLPRSGENGADGRANRRTEARA